MAIIKDFPLVWQKESYTCGVASVLAVLRYRGIWDITQDALEKEMGTTEKSGTHPDRIVQAFTDRNIKVELKRDMSLDDLDIAVIEGSLVIPMYQAWGEKTAFEYADGWGDGHYSVVTGTDMSDIFLMDPSLGSTGKIQRIDFWLRWHDFEIEDGARKEYVHAGIVVGGVIVQDIK